MTDHAVGALDSEPLVDRIRHWLIANPFSPSDVDCSTTVMLKILDGKCKMTPDDKVVMASLYDALDGASGPLLGAEIHQLIDEGRVDNSEGMKDRIYEYRVIAETRISRPVMKAFKRRIREQKLFNLLGNHSDAVA